MLQALTFKSSHDALQQRIARSRRVAADEQLIRDVEGTLEAVASALSALQASMGFFGRRGRCTDTVQRSLAMMSSLQLLVLQYVNTLSSWHTCVASYLLLPIKLSERR